MPNPLENKMLLYYLSGLGGAIGGEGSVAEKISGMTQQTIAAEEKHKLSLQYIGMIREMLGGGAKINMDKDNISIKAPSALLGGGEGMSSLITGGGLQQGRLLDMIGGIDPLVGGTKSTTPSLSASNPSSSPSDIGSADLIGLTPQDVSQALQTGLGYGALQEKSVSAVADLMYKYNALADKNRTSKIRNYEYYVGQEAATGRVPKSIEKWDAGLLKEKRLYEEAIPPAEREDYPFQEWLYDYKKLGGVQINLGDVRARGEIAADIKLKGYIRSPKFRASVEKAVDDNRRFEYEGADDPLKAREKLIWEEMNSKIMGIPGMTFGRDAAGIVGWFDENEELIVRWQ